MKILHYPEPILATPSREVETMDGNIYRLLDDMAETMYAAHGIGIAAPQVGINLRIFCIDLQEENSKLFECINPVIVDRDGTYDFEEGCLSLPGIMEPVRRSKTITIEYLDRDFKVQRLEGEGLLAVAIQHEIDHLDGKLFIDRLSKLRRHFVLRKYRRKVSVS